MNQVNNNMEQYNNMNQMYNNREVKINNNQTNGKTKLLLPVLGVLVLVGTIIGVTYAMFSFSATGTQTNVVKTGYVTINFDNVTSINLTNALPITDASVVEVSSGTGIINTMLFDVAATSNGTMVLDYDLGLTSITAGTTLTSSYIKFKLQKSVDNGSNWTYVLGDSSSGVTIASRASSAGTYNLLSTYTIDSGQITAPSTVKYKLTAWIDSSWTLPSATATATCSDTTKTTAADCYAAGGTWTQSQGTTSETFKFSVTVSATQHTTA